MLHCIEEIAYKEGYQIIVCNIENKDKYIHMLKENNVAGVILTRSVFKSIGEIPLPFVVIDEKNPMQIIMKVAKERSLY